MTDTDLFDTPIINSFSGNYRFLSNFYLVPIRLWGQVFRTTEHAYQWAKTEDPQEKDHILWVVQIKRPKTVLRAQTTPAQAKQRGKTVTLRSDWPEVRVPIMKEVNWAKYTQHIDLAERLKATDDAILIEGNTWHDNRWGSCTCDRPECGNTGDNLLGKALMGIRDRL